MDCSNTARWALRLALLVAVACSDRLPTSPPAPRRVGCVRSDTLFVNDKTSDGQWGFAFVSTETIKDLARCADLIAKYPDNVQWTWEVASGR